MTKRDKRIEKNSAAVISLRDLLRHIANKPILFVNDAVIRKALHSQAAIASLEINFTDDEGSKCTNTMSLNTLKTHANKVLEHGFAGLNNLRLAAIDSINNLEKRSLSSNKRTKSGLSKLVSELEYTLEKHRKVNFILLQGLSIAMSHIKSIRDAPDQIIREKRSREAVKTLTAIASMNPPPFDVIPGHTSIANIEDYRR